MSTNIPKTESKKGKHVLQSKLTKQVLNFDLQ